MREKTIKFLDKPLKLGKKSHTQEPKPKEDKTESKEEIKARVRAKNYDTETLIEKYVSTGMMYNNLVEEYNDLDNAVDNIKQKLMQLLEKNENLLKAQTNP